MSGRDEPLAERTHESHREPAGQCPGRTCQGQLMAALSARALDAAGTVVRSGLAAVWLVSGGIKAADPAQTYLAVQAYRVLPAGVVPAVAAALPFVELGLGLVLLAGLGTRFGAALSGLLLLVFMAGVAQAWARGLTIDCGCFGGGGQVPADRTAYGQELARDTGFLVLAGWLLVRPSSYLGVDRTLARREPVAVGDAHERPEV